MAATLTRRTLRRARQGGRHAYRSGYRHRTALAAVAAVAVLIVGGGVAIGHDVLPGFGPPGRPHSHLHGPMAGAPPDHVGGPHR